MRRRSKTSNTENEGGEMIEKIHERIRKIKNGLHDFVITLAVFLGAMFFTIAIMVMLVAVSAGTVAFFKGGL